MKSKWWLYFIIIGLSFLFTDLIFNNNITGDNLFTSINEKDDDSSRIVNWYKIFDRHELTSIAYGNGTYMVVGVDGTIKMSSDASTWKIVQASPIWLRDIVWGNNKFVAVGNKGTILISNNGENWSSVLSNTDKDLVSITWNGSSYAIVGDRGTILTSTDGTNWSKQPVDIEYSFSEIISGNGKFIACSSDTFNTILVSDNGNAWYTVAPFGNYYGFYNPVFNNGIFLLTGKIPNQEGYITIKSTDGLNWTKVEGAPRIRSITANGTSFIGVGDTIRNNNILTQYVYASEDGENWRTHEVKWDEGFYSDLKFIYWSGTKYVGLKFNGEIFSSYDALQWQKSHSDIGYIYDSITWNGTQIMAYDKNGNTLVSNDAINWEPSEINKNLPKPVLTVNNINGKLIALAGSPAKIYTFQGNANWLSIDIPNLEYSKVLWTGNNFMLITNSEIYVSPDANTWSKIIKPENLAINSIAWDGKKYVAVGGQPSILGGEGNISSPYRIIASSTNLIEWKIDKFDNIYSLNDIIWTNNMFTAIGENGAIITSTDGVNWISRISNTSFNLNKIIWDGTRYIVTGNNGNVIFSLDGRLWTKDTNNITSDNILQIIQTNNKYLGLTSDSIILGELSNNNLLVVNVNKFSDINNHWAKEYIDELALRNIIKGVTSNTFAPSRDITRAEFITILVRALELEEINNSNPFYDINELDWYYKDIITAYANGIINGYENGSINPNKPISREEAITMLSRAFNTYGKNINMTDSEIYSELSEFNDVGEIDYWAKQPAAICKRYKIVQGSEGNLRPNDNITRAEAATIVIRMLILK